VLEPLTLCATAAEVVDMRNELLVLAVLFTACTAPSPAGEPPASPTPQLAGAPPPGTAAPDASARGDERAPEPTPTGAPSSREEVEVAALLAGVRARTPGARGEDFPGCPAYSPELSRGVARELEESALARTAVAHLAPENRDRLGPADDPVAELKGAGAAFSLAAALCHENDDIKIWSARALAELGDAGPFDFVLAVAKHNAVAESGSENATIHGVLQHALADLLNAMTGEDVRLARGQDPEGLRAAIAIWRGARKR
jgi:hypothetical protein